MVCCVWFSRLENTNAKSLQHCFIFWFKVEKISRNFILWKWNWNDSYVWRFPIKSENWWMRTFFETIIILKMLLAFWVEFEIWRDLSSLLWSWKCLSPNVLMCLQTHVYSLADGKLSSHFKFHIQNSFQS